MTEITIDGVRVATLAMAAEYMGVTRMTIYTYRKEGKLAEYRFAPSKRVYFKMADLEALKARREALPNEDK